MIQKYGLKPEEILGGMRFGLDADPAQFMEAMSAALGRIVDQLNADIIRQQPGYVPPIMGVVTPNAGSMSNNFTFNLGGNTIASPMDQATFDAMVIAAIRRAIV